MLHRLNEIANFLDDHERHKDADLIEYLLEKFSTNGDLFDFEQIESFSEDDQSLETFDAGFDNNELISQASLESLGESLIDLRGEEDVKRLIEVLQTLVSD